MNTARGEVAIRPTTPADVEAYRDLRLEALRLQPEAFGADYNVDVARPIEFWLDRLRQNQGDDGAIFVAEAGGRLIGMTGLRRGYAPKGSHSGLVWGVYVRPDWRGRRIAGALIEACLEWGRAHGLRHAKLAVITANAGAIRCYLRCGFTVYGVDPEVLFVDGVYHDELLMVRRIEPTPEVRRT